MHSYFTGKGAFHCVSAADIIMLTGTVDVEPDSSRCLLSLEPSLTLKHTGAFFDVEINLMTLNGKLKSFHNNYFCADVITK